MTRKSQIEDFIAQSLDELNEHLAPEERINPAPGTALAGAEGTMDSLSLITFSVSLEEKVNSAFNTGLSLVDVLVEEMDNHPFESFGSLASWLDEQTA